MDKDKKRPTDKDGKELHEELDLGQEDEDALDRAWDKIAKERLRNPDGVSILEIAEGLGWLCSSIKTKQTVAEVVDDITHLTALCFRFFCDGCKEWTK